MVLLALVYTLTVAAILLYLYIKWTYSYWKRKGLDSLEPNYFEGLGDQFFKSYERSKAKGLKHGGCFVFFNPIYVPADLDIVKCIMQTDFSHFVNRDVYVNEEADPVRGHLFNLGNDRWKNLRQKMTPAFTSGKLKMMFPTFVNISKDLVDVIKQETTIGAPIDLKEILSRFTTDNITSIAFGLDSNSLKDPNSPFREAGKKLFSTLAFRQFVFFFTPAFIMDKLAVKLTDPAVERFLLNMVKDVVDYRETNNIYRKDFMHLLLQIKNRGRVSDDGLLFDEGKKGNFMSLNQITAQCYVFFAAGFETSATTMTYVLLELAQHQDIQDKVRAEIRDALNRNNNEITYEVLHGMEYLDKVVKETLRLHPVVRYISRKCTKDYQVPESDVVLKKGTTVMLSIEGIHMDPEYYPDPAKFDPERFSIDNVAKRHQYAYIPFGEGPRICIGARLGLLQVKMGLQAILANFKVALNEKTELPLKFEKKFVSNTIGRIWFNVEPLSH